MSNRFRGSKRHVNEFLRTETGRLAGSGIVYDDYSEESGGWIYTGKGEGRVRYPQRTEEEKNELYNSPVITYQIDD